MYKKGYSERMNKKYYDENTSEISDTKFDILKKEIIELENKYNFLKSKNSPQIQVNKAVNFLLSEILFKSFEKIKSLTFLFLSVIGIISM